MGVTPFLGEIKVFGCNFAPRGFALCNGQILAISSNTALFSLIGTFYGGNGTTNFALPNMQGRVPVHFGNLAGGSTYALGEETGTESVNLITVELPAHTHVPTASSAAGSDRDPRLHYWAADTVGPRYATTPTTSMNPAAIAPAGSGQPHENRQPVLALTFVIATQGVYPARN